MAIFSVSCACAHTMPAASATSASPKRFILSPPSAFLLRPRFLRPACGFGRRRTWIGLACRCFGGTQHGIGLAAPFPLRQSPDPVFIGARERSRRAMDFKSHLGFACGKRRHVAEHVRSHLMFGILGGI